MAVVLDEGIVDEHDDFSVEQLLVDQCAVVFDQVSMYFLAHFLEHAAFGRSQVQDDGFQVFDLGADDDLCFQLGGGDEVLEGAADFLAQARFPFLAVFHRILQYLFILIDFALEVENFCIQGIHIVLVEVKITR